MSRNIDGILCKLTSSDDDRAENFDDKLARKLREITPLITDEMGIKISGSTVRVQYLQTLISILRAIAQLNAAEVDDTSFNVNQYRSLKIAIELIISIGIIPCLQCGIGIDIAKLCPKAMEIPQEDLSCMEKYERLSLTVYALTDLFNDEMLRPSMLPHIGPIIAALLELSYAPLIKPTDENKQVPEKVNEKQFRMTTEEYQKLQHHQRQFQAKLILLLSNCPQYICIKELMVIHGKHGAPKWLRKYTRNFLINKIMQPDGVLSLIAAVCDNGLDIGTDWNKLNTISKLLATSHGENVDEYYRAICPQILDLLSSDNTKHGSVIANCCITALYDCNPSVCHKHIMEVMCAPLITIESAAIRSERDVERCIKTLMKCFITDDAKFKHLSSKLILPVATPLFCLYSNIRQSHCVLKQHVQQLLLKILEERTTREDLYSAFLGHDTSAKFGNYVMAVFRPTDGIKITGLCKDLKYEELADTIYDLASITKDLSSSIFSYILKFLSNVNKLNHRNEQREMLETVDDKMERIEMQLVAYMLLSRLASTSTVLDAQAKDPEPLLSFIKPLFDEYTKRKEDETEDNEYEILYLSLMVVKTILIERKATLEINLFKDFSIFLKRYANSKMPTQLKSLINEVINCIKMHGTFKKKYYQDLSISPTMSNKFDEAMKDLADPLLPVRAHGLITLTRLIENQDPCAVARKIIILRLFQENLKHEDSFIYLASINGLCALATAFPQVIIKILMPEYVNMPNRITGTEINVENRIKLGEILVKTTRALGEMSVVHKNMLVNGFLCTTRDTDPLVRASSLSCLGELCKVLGFRLGNVLTEIIYCIACIVKHDKAPECRRAAVLVATLLFRGLGKDTLTSLDKDLVELYRGLKHLRDKDDDPVLRLHAQLALEEIDQIVQEFLFSPRKLEKRILLLDSLS